MKEITLIMRFVVIGLIYIILFRFIRIMLIDLKLNIKGEDSIDYALEVVDSPDFSGVSIGTVFPIRDETSIGRKASNQIVINDPFVSNNHATVLLDGEKLVIRDLRSTNGMKLNNEKIEENAELKDGDILEIGRITFKVIG